LAVNARAFSSFVSLNPKKSSNFASLWIYLSLVAGVPLLHKDLRYYGEAAAAAAASKIPATRHTMNKAAKTAVTNSLVLTLYY
jgi:hypothetical protein